MDNGRGRPEYSDEQYQKWLDGMSIFLKLGHSVFYAIERAGLMSHKDSIYRKYRLNDWFCERIHVLQGYVGEIVNNIFSRVILSIEVKTQKGEPISSEDWKTLRFFAEKHRSCQPFFNQKYESAQPKTDEVRRIIDELEHENLKTDYNALGEQAGIKLESV